MEHKNTMPASDRLGGHQCDYTLFQEQRSNSCDDILAKDNNAEYPVCDEQQSYQPHIDQSHNSSESLITKNEDIEIQDIEQAQGQDTILRNLDLEGDDYYEEEYDVDEQQFPDGVEIPQQPNNALISHNDEYDEDEFENIQSEQKQFDGAFHDETYKTQAKLVHTSPQMPNLKSFLIKNKNQKNEENITYSQIETKQKIKQQKTPKKKQRHQIFDANLNQRNLLKSKYNGGKKTQQQLTPYNNKTKKDQHYLSPLIGGCKSFAPTTIIQGNSVHKTVSVDVLVIGSGPAALGFLINALKTGRLNDLMRTKEANIYSNGLAIVSEDISLGGGQLGNYGINSNTSASGFLKCMDRVVQKKKKIKISVTKGFPGVKDQSKLHQAVNNLNLVMQEAQLKIKSRATSSLASVKRIPQTMKEIPAKAKDLPVHQKLEFQQSTKPSNKQQDVPNKPSILLPFKELNESRLVNVLRQQFGKSVIPLLLVGHFMNYVGNAILMHIYQLFSTQEKQTRIFYPMHKVQQIQLMSNGECLVKMMQTKFYILQPPLNEIDEANFKILTSELKFEKNIGACQLWINPQREEVHFRAKSIILASGGKQIIHPQFFNWFPEKKSQEESVITSDYFLKKDGYLKTMTILGNMKKPQGKKKRIVIVGGSHSGFACASLLINQKPAQESEDVLKRIGNNGKVPGTFRRQVSNCQVCCLCPVKTPKCKTCICKCFGFFAYNEWETTNKFEMYNDNKPLDFDLDTDEILILFRDDIKVFYSKVQDAIEDGYTNFDKGDFSNQNGYLYSFTGLRGDAKEMYRSIVKGKEKRVKLVKADTIFQQQPYVRDADIVIWACGYQSNELPINEFVHQGKGIKPKQTKLELSQMRPGTQYDVDNKCRVMLNNNVVLNKVYGCGIGYPVRTNDGKTVQSQLQDKNKKAMNPRADGFALYITIVGDILIRNILPKELKLKGMSHKIYPIVQNSLQKQRNPITKSPLQPPFKEAIYKQDLIGYTNDKSNPIFIDALKKKKGLSQHFAQKFPIQSIQTHLRTANQRQHKLSVMSTLQDKTLCLSDKQKKTINSSQSHSRQAKSAARSSMMSHSYRRQRELCVGASDPNLNLNLLSKSQQQHLYISQVPAPSNVEHLIGHSNKVQDSLYVVPVATALYNQSMKEGLLTINIPMITKHNKTQSVDQENENNQIEALPQQTCFNKLAKDLQTYSRKLLESNQPRQTHHQPNTTPVFINSSQKNISQQKHKQLCKSPYINEVKQASQQNNSAVKQNKRQGTKPQSQVPIRKQITNDELYIQEHHRIERQIVNEGSRVVQTLMQNVLMKNMIEKDPVYNTQSSDVFPPISQSSNKNANGNLIDFNSRYSNHDKVKAREELIQQVIDSQHNKLRQQRMMSGGNQILNKVILGSNYFKEVKPVNTDYIQETDINQKSHRLALESTSAKEKGTDDKRKEVKMTPQKKVQKKVSNISSTFKQRKNSALVEPKLKFQVHDEFNKKSIVSQKVTKQRKMAITPQKEHLVQSFKNVLHVPLYKQSQIQAPSKQGYSLKDHKSNYTLKDHKSNFHVQQAVSSSSKHLPKRLVNKLQQGSPPLLTHNFSSKYSDGDGVKQESPKVSLKSNRNSSNEEKESQLLLSHRSNWQKQYKNQIQVKPLFTHLQIK